MLDAEAQNRPSMDHMWTRLVDIVILMVLPAHASTSSLAALLPYPGIILGTDVPTSNFYLNWEDVFAPGNYKQHARLIQRFKDIAGARKVLLGREHPYTLWTLNSLAWAEFMVGEPLNAAPVFDEIVKTKRRLLGEKHLETLSACCGLATLYRFVEPDYKRSLELFQETLRILKAEYGREHPITLACLQGLAFAYVRVGRSEVGAQYYDECLEIQMRKLGPLNPNTLRTRLSIEYSHFGARLAAAEESALIYEELVRLFVEQNGLEHIDTLESMYLRASVYLQLGQGTKAVMFSAEVLAARSWVLGPCHRGTLFSMEMLAKGYHQLGKVELGDRLLDQVRMARG
jgi:tetratricopeptide (TPR) repeat protein